MKRVMLLVGVFCFLSLSAHTSDQYQVFARGFQGPENLAFDGQGSLYVSDTNHLWKVDASGNLTKLYERDPAADGVSLGGVSLGSEGKIYFSVGNRIKVLNPRDGSVSVLVSGLDFANGNCFDDAGNFYIADSSSKKLYVVPAGTQELKVLVDKPGWINGLLWSRKDSTLYFTISSPGRVGGYRIGPGPKVLEEITVAKLPLSGLDDLTLDDAGNFYVCAWMNGKLVKISPDGEKQVLLEGLDGPSAAAFGLGEDSNRLYVLIKGGNTKFTGDKIISLDAGAKGYRLPFIP